MNIYSEDKNLILDGINDFDIEDVLECGQCFHFDRIGEKEYVLSAFGHVLHVKQYTHKVSEENIMYETAVSDNIGKNGFGEEYRAYINNIKLVLYNTSIEEYENIWKSYFDLDTDYFDIKSYILSVDERLSEAVKAKQGIRILRQDFFETLISFIISQNKQIPHIKQIVHTISKRYGERIVLGDGISGYTFPTVERLYEVSEDELRECKVGFRAPYIKNAVEKVYNGEITADMLIAMSADEAREKLMTIKGVGEKVANCVLLFGLGFTDSFPVDVWMKRIMEYMYFGEDTKKDVIEKFAYEKYGKYAGYAQQYLFHYGREKGLGK